jgi:hypothetical protein
MASLRQQANSEQPWLGNACPNPLLRLEAYNGTSPAQTFHIRGCMYQRRGGNVRAIIDFAKTAIHSLQRCALISTHGQKKAPAWEEGRALLTGERA